MSTKRIYCSDCETHQVCKVDPFNGSITCIVCNNFVGQDSSAGPMEKHSHNEEMPFSISTFPPTKTSDSPYIQTNISKQAKNTPKYILYFSIFCVSITFFFLGNLFFAKPTETTIIPEEDTVVTSEGESITILSKDTETTAPKIENTQPVDTLKGIQEHRMQLVEKLMPSVVLVIKTPPNQFQALKMGTGFIFKEEGYILTNHHVISGNQGVIRAMLHTGRVVNCIIESYDEISDIAILSIPNFSEIKSETSVTEWGESAELKTGQSVFALGHPQGFQFSLVMGVISNPHAYLQVFIPDKEEGNYGYFHDWIQVDASFHQGLSGGPLFDLDGKVIGINTRKSEFNGIGFCIPAEYARKIAEQLLKYKQIVRSTLGIIWAEYWNEKEHGVYVSKVLPFSPAEKSGIQKGDIIFSIGDTELSARKTSDLPKIRRIECELSLTEKIQIKLKRNQQHFNTFTLPEIRNPFHDHIMYFSNLKFWGIPISPTLQAYLKTPYRTGVWIIDIDNDSPFIKAGVMAQDMFVGTSKYFLHSDDFMNFYRQLPHKSEVPLKIQRGNKLHNLKLWIP